MKNSHYKDEHNIELADTLHNLSLAEEGLGNYDNALKYLNKCYDIWHYYHQNKLHKIMADYEYSPAEPWRKLKQTKPKQMLAYYKKSLIIYQKLFSSKHHLTARQYYLLGQAYQINNDLQKAKQMYNKSLEISEIIKEYIQSPIVLKKYQKNISLVKNVLSKIEVT